MYGFAGGDPVNFSDPFGLCPPANDGMPCTLTLGAQMAVVGLAGGALTGATSGTLVIPGVGTVVGAAGGALVGSVSGALVGATVGLGEDIALAMDWRQAGRNILGGIALVGGLITGEAQKANDGAKLLRGLIQAEEVARRTRKQQEDEQRAKRKGGRGGNDDPPSEVPPNI